MNAPTTRVGIYFTGRVALSLGTTEGFYDRRTVRLPAGFTEEQAKEAARLALYEPDGDSPAYDSITVTRITFN